MVSYGRIPPLEFTHLQILLQAFLKPWYMALLDNASCQRALESSTRPVCAPEEFPPRSSRMALGYIGDLEVARGRFICNRFATDPQDRLCKTGEVEALWGVIRRSWKLRLHYGTMCWGQMACSISVPREKPFPDENELRALLLQRLPESNVLSTFVTLHKLPLTPHLKIGRGALPPPHTIRLAARKLLMFLHLTHRCERSVDLGGVASHHGKQIART